MKVGRRRPLGIVLASLIGILAGFLRYQAAAQLPVDKDEPAYLAAAFQYRELMSQGRWKGIPNVRGTMEHPPFVKLLFATDLRVRNPQEPNWDSLLVSQPIPSSDRSAFSGARLISAICGTLQVFIIGLVNPLAGVVMAFDTYHIKYSAEAYLESVAGLMALLALFVLELGFPEKSQTPMKASAQWKVLIVSAVALGLAAAGKYLYGIVGIVLAGFVVYRTRSLRSVLLYCSIACFTFLLADPFLWPNPYSRLWESLSFHWRYAHSEQVVSSGMPWYSPIVHLLRPQPVWWHPGVFYTRLADLLILPLSIFGLRRALDERAIWVAWAGVGLLFLFMWPTKWYQYVLIVLPPLAVCAGLGIEQVGRIVCLAKR